MYTYVQYLPVASPFVLDTVTAISVDDTSLSISTISTSPVTSLTEYASFSKLTVLFTTNNDIHNKDNYEKVVYVNTLLLTTLQYVLMSWVGTVARIDVIILKTCNSTSQYICISSTTHGSSCHLLITVMSHAINAVRYS